VRAVWPVGWVGARLSREEGEAMNKLHWFLAAGLLTASVVWMAASCAIDDDVTWINGETCTDSCRTDAPASYACDVDSSCTEVEGCQDWDCTELAPPIDAGEDADADAPSPRDVEVDDDVGDAGGNPADGGEDVPPTAGECAPFGGGPTRDEADSITLGVAESELRSCPATSQWFRFDAMDGTRFVVDLRPVGEGQLSFLLYAGDDPTPVASADMTDAGTFAAFAGASTTYYLRIRSLGTVFVDYALTVSEAAAP